MLTFAPTQLFGSCLTDKLIVRQLLLRFGDVPEYAAFISVAKTSLRADVVASQHRRATPSTTKVQLFGKARASKNGLFDGLSLHGSKVESVACVLASGSRW